MSNDEKMQRMLLLRDKALSTYNSKIAKHDEAMSRANTALRKIDKALTAASEICRKTKTVSKVMRATSSRLSFVTTKSLKLASFASKKLKSIHEQINANKIVKLVRMFLRDKLDVLCDLRAALSPRSIKDWAISLVKSWIPRFGNLHFYVEIQYPLDKVPNTFVSWDCKFLRYSISPNAPNAVVAA